jgi:hypothetical protein
MRINTGDARTLKYFRKKKCMHQYFILPHYPKFVNIRDGTTNSFLESVPDSLWTGNVTVIVTIIIGSISNTSGIIKTTKKIHRAKFPFNCQYLFN